MFWDIAKRALGKGVLSDSLNCVFRSHLLLFGRVKRKLQAVIHAAYPASESTVSSSRG